MCQGVGDLYFRAVSFVPMVLQYEVYHPWAVGLEVTVFVVQWLVYLASIWKTAPWSLSLHSAISGDVHSLFWVPYVLSWQGMWR